MPSRTAGSKASASIVASQSRTAGSLRPSPHCGSERPRRFSFGRDCRPDDALGQPRSPPPAGVVAWTGASLDERSGLDQQSPVARNAVDEQEEYSLDDSFLRS